MSIDLQINSMLGDLRLIDSTLETSDDLLKVYSIFEKEKNIPGIILLKDGRFHGLLSRTKFFEVMSKQYMYDLFSKRKVEFFFENGICEEQLILDSSILIINATNFALNRKEADRYEPIVVSFGQNEFKLLDFYDLILAQNTILLLMNDLLKKANEFKNEVLAIVAHDLRNPISAILGFSSLISELPDDSTEFKPFTSHINMAALQMQELVNSFLVSAINDAVEFDVTFTSFDIQELLTGIVNNFKHAAALKGQHIKFMSSLETSRIISDKLKVTEVVENLISNAVKYSEVNKGIVVLLRQNCQNFIISVSDQGPGFKKHDLEKIYGKFQRLSARPTKGEPSTGLGLFTVKKIIDKLKGEISLDTEPGKGSTFTIYIPINGKA